MIEKHSLRNNSALSYDDDNEYEELVYKKQNQSSKNSIMLIRQFGYSRAVAKLHSKYVEFTVEPDAIALLNLMFKFVQENLVGKKSLALALLNLHDANFSIQHYVDFLTNAPTSKLEMVQVIKSLHSAGAQDYFKLQASSFNVLLQYAIDDSTRRVEN